MSRSFKSFFFSPWKFHIKFSENLGTSKLLNLLKYLYFLLLMLQLILQEYIFIHYQNKIEGVYNKILLNKIFLKSIDDNGEKNLSRNFWFTKGKWRKRFFENVYSIYVYSIYDSKISSSENLCSIFFLNPAHSHIFGNGNTVKMYFDVGKAGNLSYSV